MLKIRQVQKSYGNKLILKGIDLSVSAGEIFGFIGHNGAGKTTLIRCIMGIHEFEQGEILIDGKSIAEDPIGCKQIMAYIPDNPDLYENFTGIQFLTFTANIYGVEMKMAAQEIEALAKEFELFENLGDLIGTYSHGMKQKLVLISAFIHHPKLLVLDEPFVGLDPKAAWLLKQKMQQLCSEGGAIFFSTHVLDVVEKLCDRVAIIQQGEIVKEGKTEEITQDASLEEVFLRLDHE